ncbi:selenocysteine-tRNA-specific elongation factor [Trypanosoma cruzi Dm28c]|uniref:Selenocysteine-tRNA-specific elongation factor n=1 Tax=Trypanosoma cruzi Dm28c TaxID=1416333 RepID=V5CP78_TRYCR|nr:selenocysteine-tRNA-specific elongation factor [Trypanosoma cruzi Dm28c]
MFRAFDVTTWAPRIWDEGVSGVFLDLRGAYNYWQGADDQAQLVVDSLFAWMCALEAERDPTEHFMNFGKILLQAFRMQLMMASDPGIPLFNILARLCTAVHEADTFARATQPLAERRGTQISLRCQMCPIYGHDVPTCNVRDATGGSYSQHGWPLKTAEGLLAASYESGRRQPHPIHHLPPLRTGIASHRRCPARYYEFADTIVEKDNGAYPQRNSNVVRRSTDLPALGQLHEESERGRSRDVGAVNVEAEDVLSGAIHNLLLHARTADERGELRVLFNGNRCGAIDPTAVRQDAAVHVGNGSNPAGHGDSEATKDCGAIRGEAGAPLDRGRDGSSNPQPDRLEGTCCF